MIVAGFPPTTGGGGGGGGLIVVVTPSSVSASGDSNSPETMVTGAATASASGGTAPYTYSWAKVGGGTYTIDSPSASSTTFSKVSLAPGTFNYAARCTVTDSASGSGSDTVGITFVAS